MKPDIKIISLLVVLFVAVYLAPEAEGGFRVLRSIRRIRVRLPTIRRQRIQLPRTRLPRIRLPRIQLRRIRLPRFLLTRKPCVHRGKYTADPFNPCRRICIWRVTDGTWRMQCHRFCPNYCDRRDKRVIGQQPDPAYGVISLVPNQFADYDENKDGFISLDEFAKTLRVDAKEAKQGLDMIDQDDDGKISEEEFNNNETNDLDERQEGDVSDVEATARALIERGLKEEDVEEYLRNGIDSRSLFNHEIHDDNKDDELDNEELYLRSLIESIDDDEESNDDEGVDLRSFGEDEADDDVDDDVDEDTELVLEALARELKKQTTEDGE